MAVELDRLRKSLCNVSPVRQSSPLPAAFWDWCRGDLRPCSYTSRSCATINAADFTSLRNLYFLFQITHVYQCRPNRNSIMTYVMPAGWKSETIEIASAK